ncbi:hypothetical protein RRG08_002149 [Elysia crispata]|uniref:Uncharacterized protein n=1 Tax=Elysia crispata TaxID=231223 RepID=A0AAE0ZAT4_9GAST|nr:hypothetical protein RRG08_002149 [Elysia crispata]
MCVHILKFPIFPVVQRVTIAPRTQHGSNIAVSKTRRGNWKLVDPPSPVNSSRPLKSKSRESCIKSLVNQYDVYLPACRLCSSHQWHTY